jgi:hypothetical protein
MKKLFLLTIILAMSGYQMMAGQNPTVSVRLNNPRFDCPTHNYCVDVEFMADSPNYFLFGMNVRLFYDDNILEFDSFGSFEGGYISMGAPEVQNFGSGSGAPFGLAGPAEWVNGAIQLGGLPSLYLSTTEWTKLFSICFHVDDPTAINLESFCPSLIWDLQMDPQMGGYLPGDDGVVITVKNQSDPQYSIPATTAVLQYNWNYVGGGDVPFGSPAPVVCISTKCGEFIPLSDWSLYLAIGLMVIATALIWRRRMT